MSKQVDLATLTGWANLSAGEHTITIKAKADGYKDSQPSAGVQVTTYVGYITFTGETSEFTLSIGSGGAKEWDGTVWYSTDHNTWTVWDGTAITSVNKKLYLRGKNNTKFYTSNGKGARLSLSAKASCSGNIQTLLDWETQPTKISGEYCYHNLFFGCTNLTSAPALPATTLALACYQTMFYGCTSLTSAPELPATVLASNCYDAMFAGCTSLKISDTTGTKIFTCPSSIPNNAVSGMFSNTGGTFTGTPAAGNTYYWYQSSGYTVTMNYSGYTSAGIGFYSLDAGSTWTDCYVAGQSKLVLNNVEQIMFKVVGNYKNYIYIYRTSGDSFTSVSVDGSTSATKQTANITLTQDMVVQIDSGLD
nr:MAG TPA: hypothetical protein [Caudoviricetes sp.]